MPRPRAPSVLLRLTRWGTVALCVAILLLYAGSFALMWESAWRAGAGRVWGLCVNRGWIVACRCESVPIFEHFCGMSFPDGPPIGLSPSARPGRAWGPAIVWNERIASNDGTPLADFYFMLPLWPLALAAGAGAAGLTLPPFLRRRSRRRRGACEACGYSRAGLGLHQPCPECGRAPTGGKAQEG